MDRTLKMYAEVQFLYYLKTMNSQLYPNLSIITVLDSKKTGIQFIRYIKKLKNNIILCKVHQLRDDLPLNFSQTYNICKNLVAKIQEGEPRLLRTLKHQLNPADQRLVLKDKYAILLLIPLKN